MILNTCFHSLDNWNMWTNAESARLAYYPLTDEWNLPSSARLAGQPTSSSSYCYFHWVSRLPLSFKINTKTQIHKYKYKRMFSPGSLRSPTSAPYRSTSSGSSTPVTGRKGVYDLLYRFSSLLSLNPAVSDHKLTINWVETKQTNS